MKNQRNYYRILHVQPDAPLPVIRMSYRTIMQKLKMHPDVGGDDWNAGVINEAYAVLSDEAQRRAYDANLFAERSKANAASQRAGQRKAETAEPGSGTAPPEHEPEPPGQGQSWHASFHHYQQSTSLNCAFCSKSYLGLTATDPDCLHCGCPLLKLTPQQLESACQRNIQRMPTCGELTIHHRWPGPAHVGALNDLSLNGLQFDSAATLPTGSPIRIYCDLFIAVAEVVNARLTGVELHTYGARFETLRFNQQAGTFVATSV